MVYIRHIDNDRIVHYSIKDNDTMSIPHAPGNRHYDRMMEAVEAGEAELVEVDDTSVLTYADNRRRAYASAGDQLDMQYHDAVDSTTTWKDHVAAVKAANPKP